MGDRVVRILSVFAMVLSALTFGLQIGPAETTLAVIFFVFSLAILLSVSFELDDAVAEEVRNVERD